MKNYYCASCSFGKDSLAMDLPFYMYKNQSIQDLEKSFKEKDKLFIENEKK